MAGKKLYKCELCGNVVELVVAGGGKLVCCGKEMTLLPEQTDESNEKHVPVIEVSGEKVKVTVGSIKHPMEEKHFIQFIELIADDKVYRKDLKPGDEPVAEFSVKATSLTARDYCNLHGLWKSEK